MQKNESIFCISEEILEFYPGSSERSWESQIDKLPLQINRIIFFMVKRSLSRLRKGISSSAGAQIDHLLGLYEIVWKGRWRGSWMTVDMYQDPRKAPEVAKKEWHILPKALNTNCPLTHHSWHMVSSLFTSTTAFTNISESTWSRFGSPEFLLQIRFASGNHWGHLDRGFQFNFLWKEFSLHTPKSLGDSNQCEATGDDGGLRSKLFLWHAKCLL